MMFTDEFLDIRPQRQPALFRNNRWKRLAVVVLVLVTAILGLPMAAYQLNKPNLAPAIPPYPKVERACYPSRLEAQILGEAFCGLETRDSYRAVVDFYNSYLPQYGWNGRWYRNAAGYCYTLLIIENSPTYARTPPGVTSVAFKLRQAFYSELNTTAPPGCK